MDKGLTPAAARPQAFPPLPAEGAAELRVLLTALRARFDPSALVDLRRAVDAEVDGARLAEVARRHRVGALVSTSLREAGVRGRPWTAEIDDAAKTVAIRGLRLAMGLARTVDLLAAAGVRPLALKGPVLAADLYGDVGLRPCGDLDLLIAEDQLTKARRALERAGFRPDPALGERAALEYLAAGFAYSFRDDERDLVVEIHPSLAHRAFQFAPDLEGIWRRARPASVAGRDILALSPEDRLLFLCVHGAKHEWDQLIWVCDVAEALRASGGLDWPGVLGRAAETGSVRMLQLGLHLARALVAVPLPAEAAGLADAAGLPELALQVWARMLEPLDRRPGLWSQLRFHLRVRERPAQRWGQTQEKVGDRFRSAAQRTHLLVAPSAADRAFVALPPRLRMLYVLVRPVRVILGAGARGLFERASSRTGGPA